MRASVAVMRRNILLGLGLVSYLLLGSSPLRGQSLTSGSLHGTVQTADGQPVTGASVTLESRTGAALLNLESGRDGAFDAQLLTPGEYRVLVEQIGYQPLRARGIIVTAGATTVVVITVERVRPVRPGSRPRSPR